MAKQISRPEWWEENSKEMQRKFIGHLLRNHFPVVSEYVYLYKKESDVLSVKENLIYEFEFKINEGDFLRDKYKNRHSSNSQTPNYFYYVIPDYLKDVVNEKISSSYGFVVASKSKDGYLYFKWEKLSKQLKEEQITIKELLYISSKLTDVLYG
jgi:hypothetical protein